MTTRNKSFRSVPNWKFLTTFLSGSGLDEINRPVLFDRLSRASTAVRSAPELVLHFCKLAYFTTRSLTLFSGNLHRFRYILCKMDIYADSQKSQHRLSSSNDGSNLIVCQSNTFVLNADHKIR